MKDSEVKVIAEAMVKAAEISGEKIAKGMIKSAETTAKSITESAEATAKSITQSTEKIANAIIDNNTRNAEALKEGFKQIGTITSLPYHRRVNNISNSPPQHVTLLQPSFVVVLLATLRPFQVCPRLRRV